MKQKAVYIIGAILALLGVFIAAMGVGMNDRPGQNGSGNTTTWLGLAIIVIGIGLGVYGGLQAKKVKGE